MGSGKTIMAALFGLEMDFRRVLIVGVKDTWDSWSERLAIESDGFQQMYRMDTTKKGQANIQRFLDGEPGYFFIGHALLTRRDWQQIEDSRGKRSVRTKFWESAAVDALFVDEIHLMSNRKSNGWKTLKSIRSEWKLGLSGTWYGNQFENAWSVCRFLWGDLIDPSQARWAEEWCAKEHAYGKGGVKHVKYIGEKNPGEFVKTLPCYTRIDDGDRPPAEIEVKVPLNDVQRYQYDEFENNMLVWLGEHPLVADLPVTMRSRLRQITLATPSIRHAVKGGESVEEVYFDDDATSSKADAALDIAFSEFGERIVHLTDSQRYASYFVKRLRAAGYVAEEWSGKVSTKERERIKKEFLDGKIDHLVAVIEAFSTGLDGFQKVCRRIIWHSKSDNGTSNDQAVMRIYRTGGDKENFKHWYIQAIGTKDEGQYNNLLEAQLKRNQTLRKAQGMA